MKAIYDAESKQEIGCGPIIVRQPVKGNWDFVVDAEEYQYVRLSVRAEK